MKQDDLKFDYLFGRMKEGGDHAAFHQLFHAFYPPLCVMACRLTKDRCTAEDIVQDVFTVIWERREDIELTGTVRSYLFTSTRNRCLNAIRRVQVMGSYAEYAKWCETDYAHSDCLLTMNELQDKLEDILNRLPESYRIAFVMGQMHEQKTSIIAERLHVSERTVERYRAKAMEIVEEELRDYMPLLILLAYSSA